MAPTSAATAAGRPLTGRGVLAWLIGFFAVIFAANIVFIYLALTTFPGLEVASSYKAGQEFEAEVAAAKVQAERGWTVAGSAERAGEGADVGFTFADRSGIELAGLDVRVTLAHAVNTDFDRTVVLPETSPGTYAAHVPDVVAGHWTLIVEASRRGERMFLSRNAVTLR